MHDTVDQAHGAVPRTLVDIIQGAFRPCVVTAAPTAPDGRAHSPAPARMGCTWRGARARLRGLIGEAAMTAVLALAGDVFTDATVIYGSTR
jgi:hypothetical protein